MKMTTGLMALALLAGTLPALAAEKGGMAYVNLPKVMTESKADCVLRPFRGWRFHQGDHLFAGDYALYLGVDYHSASGRQ